MIRPGNSNSGRRALLHTWAEAANVGLVEVLQIANCFKNVSKVSDSNPFYLDTVLGNISKRTESWSISRGEMCNLGAFGATVSMTASNFIHPKIQEPSAETWKRMGKFPREDDTKNMNSTPSGAQLRGHYITNPNNALV